MQPIVPSATGSLLNAPFDELLNIVFNIGMNTKHPIRSKDAELIAALGGPVKLAERLGYSRSDGGAQRVGNWVRRGIPAAVKLDHPEIFQRNEAQSSVTSGT